MTKDEKQLAKAEEGFKKFLKKVRATQKAGEDAMKDNGLEYAGERDPTARNKPTKRIRSKTVKRGKK